MPIIAPDTPDLDLGQSQIQPADTYSRPMAEDDQISKNAARARQNGDMLSAAFNELGHSIRSTAEQIGGTITQIYQDQEREADKNYERNQGFIHEQLAQEWKDGVPQAAANDPVLADLSVSGRAHANQWLGKTTAGAWVQERIGSFYQQPGALWNNKDDVNKYADQMIAEAWKNVRSGDPSYGGGYMEEVRQGVERFRSATMNDRINWMKDMQLKELAYETPTSPIPSGHDPNWHAPLVGAPPWEAPTPPHRPEDVEHKKITPEKGKETHSEVETANKVAAADSGTMSDATNDNRRTGGFTRAAPPASPYEAALVGSYAGKSNGESQECVALVKQATNVGHTSDWQPGGAISANTPVGTAIATFGADGRYKNKPGESHAAIYLGPGQTPGSIKVLDQWNGHAAGVREIRQGTGPEGAEKFQVINGKGGVAQARATDDGGKRPFGVPQGYGQKGYAQQSYDPVAIIAKFEGFRETPYWDVNANRVGYGSDTITKEDGTVVKVTPGMRVTEADARRDLQRRVGEFQGGIQRDIGADAWARLTPGAQAALTSIAYNYGTITKIGGLVEAAKKGDLNGMARIVAAQETNHSRRLKEAAMIMGGDVGFVGPDGNHTSNQTYVSPTSGQTYYNPPAQQPFNAAASVHEMGAQASNDALANALRTYGGGKSVSDALGTGSTSSASGPQYADAGTRATDAKGGGGAENTAPEPSGDSGPKKGAAGASSKANMDALNAQGIVSPTKSDIYIANTVGAPLAAKIIKAAGNAKLTDFLAPSVLKAHPELARFNSVSQFRAWASQKTGQPIHPITLAQNEIRDVDAYWHKTGNLVPAMRRDAIAKRLAETAASTGDKSILDRLPPEWMNGETVDLFAKARKAADDTAWASHVRAKQVEHEQREEATRVNMLTVLDKASKGQPINPLDYKDDPEAWRFAVQVSTQPKVDQITSARNVTILQNKLEQAEASGNFGLLDKEFEGKESVSDVDIIKWASKQGKLINPDQLSNFMANVSKVREIGAAINKPIMKSAETRIYGTATRFVQSPRITAATNIMSWNGDTPQSLPEEATKRFQESVRDKIRTLAAERELTPQDYSDISRDAEKETNDYLKEQYKIISESLDITPTAPKPTQPDAPKEDLPKGHFETIGGVKRFVPDPPSSSEE